MNQTATKSGGFFYGWVIVGISTLALVVSNGLAIGGIPVFSKWIKEDFIKSGAIMSGQAETVVANFGTITFLVAGFFSPVAAYFIQKFNVRLLMIIGCLILGAALVLHSQATSANTSYVSRALMGVSLGFIGVLGNTVLVSNWFRRLRGTAIGIVLTGTSFGGVLIPLLATPLILRYGWRTAMIAVSLIIWLFLLPAIIFLVKNKPSDSGLLPDGEQLIDEPQFKTGNLAGLTLSEAFRTPIFWVLALCSALIFYPLFVTTQQFILYAQTPKIGFTPAEAGVAQSLLFAVSVGGKFLFGFLSDRFSPTRVMLACCTVMFLATLVLLNLTANTAFFYLIPFGLGYGGTFVLLQRLVADYFGLKEYGKILGVITLIETVGAAIGGKITGSLADANGGDYTQAFYWVIVTTGLALACVVLLNFITKSKRIVV